MQLLKTRTILSAAAFAVATSLSTAAAGGDATKNALEGPEKRRTIEDAKGKKHEFNVKPVSYCVRGDTVWVIGQLSHHLRLQGDDQFWYRIVKQRGRKATTHIIKIKRNRISEAFGYLSGIEHVKDIVDHPWVKGAAAIIKKTDKIANRGRGWEGAAAIFIERLAKRVDTLKPKQPKKGVTFYKDSMMRGWSKPYGVRRIVNLKKEKLNDTISSLTALVPKGTVLELFEHAKFKGRKMVLQPGSHVIRSLKVHGLNDKFSSFRFVRTSKR